MTQPTPPGEAPDGDYFARFFRPPGAPEKVVVEQLVQRVQDLDGEVVALRGIIESAVAFFNNHVGPNAGSGSYANPHPYLRLASLGLGQSGSAPVVGNGGTIASGALGVSRVAPAAAVTGVILTRGTKPGQLVVVLNESAAANSVTFAASGTSFVANGTSCVIAGLTARQFVWNTSTNLWYPTA